MHIDFKQTTWERAFVKKEDEEDVLKVFKNDKINDSSDLTCYTDVDEWENLIDTGEQMTVEENKGNATIEIFMNKGQLIPTENNGAL